MKTLLGSLLLVLIHANVAAHGSIATVTETLPSTIKGSPPANFLERLDDAKPLAASQVATGSFPCKRGDLLSVHNAPGEEENRFVISLARLNRSYEMQRVDSVSGAVRLENRHGIIVLLQLANKTMLLDLKKGKTLANDCQSAAQYVFAEEMANNPNRQSMLK